MFNYVQILYSLCHLDHNKEKIVKTPPHSRSSFNKIGSVVNVMEYIYYSNIHTLPKILSFIFALLLPGKNFKSLLANTAGLNDRNRATIQTVTP